MGSGCGCSTCGLRTHLFQHFRFHFLHRGLSFVGSYHPCVSVRIHDGAAPITPKHIDHRALACGSEVNHPNRVVPSVLRIKLLQLGDVFHAFSTRSISNRGDDFVCAKVDDIGLPSGEMRGN
jgi:hypothetical protein